MLTTKVFLKDEPWLDTKAIYVMRINDYDNKREILVGDDWIEYKPGTEPEKPTLRLSKDLFQQIIDLLSEQVKPTAMAEADAELKATKLHLNDMRDLVFFKEMGKTK